MLCAISGEPPQVPVASRKSGTIYEKRLIESYIAENGTDPVDGSELTLDDLLDLKSSRLVHPRPPTQTSIPALLATFQNEWDALALETFELKKQLAQTRQELSTALYDYEGALRILARVQKERDDARASLAKVQVGGSVGAVDGMEVDGAELNEELVEIVDSEHKKLSAGRRKRPVPQGWSTPADIQEFDATRPEGFKPSDSFPVGSAAAVAESEEEGVYATENGQALVYSQAGDSEPQEINAGSKITDALFWESRTVFALASGGIKIYEGSVELASYSSHAGPATGIAIHPSGQILASVGTDKSYILYDLRNTDGRATTRVFTDSELLTAKFHPDGHLLAVGGKDGEVKIFDIKTGSVGAQYKADGPVRSLTFSENGYWLASASTGSTHVTLWDLRKEGDAALAKSIEFGAPVSDIAFDHTAQFLAIVGGGSVAVQFYQKSSKKWSELLKKAINARRVAWDPNGQHLLVDSEEGPVYLQKAES